MKERRARPRALILSDEDYFTMWALITPDLRERYKLSRRETIRQMRGYLSRARIEDLKDMAYVTKNRYPEIHLALRLLIVRRIQLN
jgi:hypothetical protein